MNKENKFSIQCFNCQKQYQSDVIPRRCKYCQSGNIETKESGGSIVDMDNSARINCELCNECGKGCRVWSPDNALPQELEAEKEKRKKEDRWCEGNCQTQRSSTHSTHNKSISNSQNSQVEREREREREREQYQLFTLDFRRGWSVRRNWNSGLFLNTKGENK